MESFDCFNNDDDEDDDNNVDDAADDGAVESVGVIVNCPLPTLIIVDDVDLFDAIAMADIDESIVFDGIFVVETIGADDDVGIKLFDGSIDGIPVKFVNFIYSFRKELTACGSE